MLKLLYFVVVNYLSCSEFLLTNEKPIILGKRYLFINLIYKFKINTNTSTLEFGVQQ